MTLLPRLISVLSVMTAVALLALPAGPAMAGDDARDVARRIYRLVEKACPEDGDGLPYNLADIARDHFSPELQDQLSRAYRDHRLDFDVLIDARDCAIDDVDIDTDDDHDDRGRAIASAKFKNFGERRKVELVMVSMDGGWKVADIRYQHRNWSLTRDLR